MSAQNNDVLYNTIEDSVDQDASQVNPSETVTGEDSDFTVWQAPADDSMYDGWPAVPRRLPRSDAHGILNNTSIDERNPSRDRAVHREQTAAQRRAQQAAIQIEIEADRRAEREEQAAEEEAREHEAANNADLAGDQLRVHQRQQPELINVFESSCKRWAEEDPSGAADFDAHPRCNTQEQEAILIRAAFELRKVRLDHEQDPALRWPQCNSFENSLDNSVRQWCRDAYDHYLDENGEYRRLFSDDLAETLVQIHAYGEDIG
jgi:hypothetical protein